MFLQIDNARHGSLDDLIAITTMTKFNIGQRMIPTSICEDIFNLAIYYIAEGPPSANDYSYQALQRGQFVSYSFMAINNVFLGAFDVPHVSADFIRLWPQAFLWVGYLRRAVDYLYKHDTMLDAYDSEEISGQFASSISVFLVASCRDTHWQTRETYFSETKVNDFIVHFWESERTTRVGSMRSAELLYHFLKGDAWNDLLDILQRNFSSPREIARLAIGRVRVALSSFDFDAMSYHYLPIAIVLVKNERHPVHKAILEENVLPLALMSISTLLSFTSLTFAPDLETMGRCLRIVFQIYNAGAFKADYFAQGFEHGLIETYFNVGQYINLIQEDVRSLATNLLKICIPYSIYLRVQLQAVHRGMIAFSKKLRNKPFAIETLQESFKDVWQDFETLILEHTILRYIRATQGQRASVYCSNVSYYYSMFALFTYT